LHPLPIQAFVVAEWRKAKVNIDYHIEIEGHYYSTGCSPVRRLDVPYKHARQTVDVRLTGATLEVFSEGQRIASHARVPDLPKHKGRHSTISDHMPKSHQRYGDWSPRSYRHPGTTG
jgi:hypothetical protein